MKRHYPDIALHVPKLLLPAPGVPLETWSVIACDQYTSEPEYWDETRRLVGDNPSTLALILPEARLDAGDRERAVAGINRRMAEYLATGVLVEQRPGFMLVERDAGRDAPRRGLVVALDLECFDFRPGARQLIRSTEGTDPARLPARIAVRRDASLEAPHILVLIDDPDRTVIEPLFEHPLAAAYDVALMQGGGRVRGWHVDDAKLIDTVAARLAALRQGEPPMLYAMGDGNHSFAAARAVWEDVKRQVRSAPDHPARYALVELVNVYDDGLEFAPIHRLVDGVDPAQLAQELAAHFADAGYSHRSFGDRNAWRRACRAPAAGHRLPYLTATGFGLARIEQPRCQLEAASLQGFLDDFMGRNPNMRIDYIHGDDALARLAAAEGRTGFLLPAMDKHDLFKTVVRDGATPRKTFSLGEANEKRYYLECRRIRQPETAAS